MTVFVGRDPLIDIQGTGIEGPTMLGAEQSYSQL
jgi:hypothetical protein